MRELRDDLQDTSASPRWTDDVLFLYFKDAIRDYSIWFPRREDRYALSLVGSAYPLPNDFLEDIAVEVPKDTFLKRLEQTPGEVYRGAGRATRYYLSGGNLYLDYEASEVLLTYFAMHPMPENKSDKTFVITVPERDLELPRLYIRAKVHSQMRSKQSRLDRFDPGSGRRDDNPLLPETQDLWAEYHTRIQARQPGGVIRLYYAGRTR